jgi:hypothetical protein
MPKSTVSPTASRPRRRLRHLPIVTLAAVVLSASLALSAQAAPSGKHAPATRVSNHHVKRVSGACAKAHKHAAPPRHAGGNRRSAHQTRARHRPSSGRHQTRCATRAVKHGLASTTATVPQTAGNGTSRPTGAPATTSVTPSPGSTTYVSPQFLGQHLMFFSALNPAFPVHAMRLWDSNTQWCQMDSGTASNEYDFNQLDALFGQASRLGADVEFTFGYTPHWAATGSYPQSSAVNQCSASTDAAPPANESYWKNYVTAVVSHSVGKIHAYELWNEVNDPNYWSGSVAQMVRMSIDAATIIHRLDPSALVLSPSITNTSQGYSWLHQFLSSVPQGTINAIAVHSYAFGYTPEQFIPAEMSAVRSALPAAYAGMPIWSTEGGWGENSQLSSAVGDQAAFVARYDLQMLSQGVTRSYWYAYPNTQWGTLWDGTALTPAGIASGSIESWLSGATFSGCGTSDGNLWTCNLTLSNGKPAQIVWATQWAAWYPTTYATAQTLEGTTAPTNGWVQAVYEPVLLS